MKSVISRIFSNSILLIFITAVIKLPLLLTKNIQEDSFITWRVARNLLHYGVIGFNSEERISASTTHLYVLVTAFFQLIFGEYFINPLLVFSGVLFAVGSLWLSKILFPHDILKQGFFVIFLNMLPPSLSASALGMEYGILFFLYCSLIYFGIFKEKKWAYLILPILLLWTRIDCVIFLGVFFLADLVLKKKINGLLILGGILGLSSVVCFNYLYFGELINHTIAAKKIAYKNLIQNDSWEYSFYQWAYYGGLIKKYSIYTFLLFCAFLVFLMYCVFRIAKDRLVLPFKTKVILIAAVLFALLKITLFSYFKAYFDWYYWLPRVFIFVIVLYYVLQFLPVRQKFLLPIVFLTSLGLYSFQLLQSYTIGFMEERQRMQIAADIGNDEGGMKHSILLEPAGIIPFYTNLYTYDEVGLVDKRINEEMLKDENFWWINSVKRFRPDYILTIAQKPGGLNGRYAIKPQDIAWFEKDYKLVKIYPIAKIYDQAPRFLKPVYRIRPIGKDYYLYQLVK